MLKEIIFDAVRNRKTALFIERQGNGAVARADEHCPAFILIVFTHVVDQMPAVAFPLKLRTGRQILYLVDAVSLVRDNADTFQTAVVQREQSSPVQILVDHILLLVCQQQQIEEVFFVVMDDFDFQADCLPSRRFYIVFNIK